MKTTFAIARAPKYPQAALEWFKKNNLTPPAENKLEVINLGDDSVEINLLGSVGDTWDESGITEKDLRSALDAAKGKKILLNVNSPGGYVGEGLGLYNAINSRKSDITCRITGYALSAASFFPLAASRVISPKASIWMIHPAQWLAIGSATDLRKTADALDVHDASIIGIYAKKTGKTAEEIKAAMEKETWMTGEEAVAFGLAEADPEEMESAENSRAASANLAAGAMPVNAAPISQTQSPATPPVTNPNPNPPTPMPENTTPAAAPTAANDALAQVQAQLANERRARITAEVTRRAENKIKNDQLEKVINMAVADEQGAYAFIDSLPSAQIGAEPLGAGRLEVGSPQILNGFGQKPTATVENIFKAHSTPEARYAALKENYATAMAEANRKDNCRPGVLNANSYSSTLTTNFLVMGATVKIGPKFAPIKAFARDVSVDPYKPLASGVMKFTTSVQDGSDVQTNATNFTTGDSTVTAVTVSVAQYTASANLTNSDLNSGIRMEDIALPKLRSLGSKIVQIATAPITAANYTNSSGGLAGLTKASTNFGFNDLQTLWGQLKKANTKNILLDGEYLANLVNIPNFFQVALNGGDNTWSNAFGWDLIALNTEWSGAGTGVRGFACDPQAIGCIAGLPLIDSAGIPGGILSVSTGSIPGVNLPIAAYLWFDVTARTYYMSYDMMFGASKMDNTAGALITSA